MSNDEFNALTPEELTANLMSSINNMIPTVESSFKQMESMNEMILTAMAKYFEQAINFLEKWIKGGVHGFQHNIADATGFETDDTKFIEESGFQFAGGSEQTFHNLPVPATQTTFTPIEKFAAKWMNPSTGISNLTTMTQAEALFILKNIQKGNLDLFKRFRAILIKHMDSFNVKPKTPKETFEETIKIIKTKTPATGIMRSIANQFAKLELILKSKRSPRNDKMFLIFAKVYNQFVAKNSLPKLQIDTSASMKARRPIPK